MRDASTGTVTDSTISQAAGYGIYVDDPASLEESDNTFEDNADGEIGGGGEW